MLSTEISIALIVVVFVAIAFILQHIDDSVKARNRNVKEARLRRKAAAKQLNLTESEFTEGFYVD